MTRIYIHECADWPKFRWDVKGLAPLLSSVRLLQGLLLGKMQSYGFASQWTATLKVLTEETSGNRSMEFTGTQSRTFRPTSFRAIYTPLMAKHSEYCVFTVKRTLFS